MTLLGGVVLLLLAIINALFLTGMPVVMPDALLVAANYANSDGSLGISIPDSVEWADSSTLLQDTGWFRYSGPISLDRLPGVPSGWITSNALSVLGVAPHLGRLFTADDTRAVILSYSLWHQRFAADPSIVGQMLAVEGTLYEVVGVMPPRFSFPTPDVELWLPLIPNARQLNDAARSQFLLLARLRPSASLDAARRELAAVNASLDRAFPRDVRRIVSVRSLSEFLSPKGQALHFVLWMAVLLLVLLASANCALLLLARHFSRYSELATRLALGAQRRHILAQLGFELLFLSAISVGLSLLLLFAGTEHLERLASVTLPSLRMLEIDARWVLGAGIVVFAISAISSSLACASLFSWNISVTMRGPASQHRMQAALLLVETAITVLLVAGTTSYLTQFLEMNRGDWGFEPSNGVLVSVRYPFELMTDIAGVTQKRDFAEGSLTSLRRLPGVAVASAAASGPLIATATEPFLLEYLAPANEPRLLQAADVLFVADGFFEALGVRLASGQGFSEGNRNESAPRAVLNSSAAGLLFGTPSAAVGQQVVFATDSASLESDSSSIARYLGFRSRLLNQPVSLVGRVGDPSTVHRIVGVVADMSFASAEILGQQDVGPRIYLDYRWHALHESSSSVAGELSPFVFLVRFDDASRVSPEPVQRLLLEARPDISIVDSASLDTLLLRATGGERTLVLLYIVALLAIVALVLAGGGAAGIAGTLAKQAAHGIAVRRALGATELSVLLLLCWRVGRLCLFGGILGLMLAAGMHVLLATVADHVFIRGLPLGLLSAALTVVVILAASVPAMLQVTHGSPAATLRRTAG